MTLVEINIILEVINGEIINNVSIEAMDITKICTDTRKLQKGDVFLTLKGENFNGNNFIQNAIDSEVSCVICDESYTDNNINVKIILVKNALEAYGKIANYYRNIVLKKSKVIAITGSVGKTTTKNLLGFVLNGFTDKVYISEANLNNHIGVPYNILKAPCDSECVILEMGMQAAGEINYLSKIAEPDIAIITNVSSAHLEFFKNVSEIAKAKAEIFNYLKPNGWAIINKNNYSDILYDSAKKVTDNILFYNNDCSDVNEASLSNLYLKSYSINDDNSCYVNAYINGYGDCHYKLSIGILSLIKNSLVVFAIGKILNLDFKKIIDVIYNFSDDNLIGRGHVIVKDIDDGGKIVILDETYNCGVKAMEASLKNLITLPFKNIDGFTLKRRVAILGEMKELGESSLKIHSGLVNFLNDVNLIGTIGGDNIKVLNDLIIFDKNIGHFKDVDEFLLHVAKNSIGIDKKFPFKDGDLILIKGARSNKLEKILNFI